MIRSFLKRKTDVDRLKAWIAANPEKAVAALIAQGLHPRTIERVLSGKTGEPRPTTRRLFCNATGMAESVLFPLAREEAA